MGSLVVMPASHRPTRNTCFSVHLCQAAALKNMNVAYPVGRNVQM